MFFSKREDPSLNYYRQEITKTVTVFRQKNAVHSDLQMYYNNVIRYSVEPMIGRIISEAASYRNLQELCNYYEYVKNTEVKKLRFYGDAVMKINSVYTYVLSTEDRAHHICGTYANLSAHFKQKILTKVKQLKQAKCTQIIKLFDKIGEISSNNYLKEYRIDDADIERIIRDELHQQELENEKEQEREEVKKQAAEKAEEQRKAQELRTQKENERKNMNFQKMEQDLKRSIKRREDAVLKKQNTLAKKEKALIERKNALDKEIKEKRKQLKAEIREEKRKAKESIAKIQEKAKQEIIKKSEKILDEEADRRANIILKKIGIEL